MEFWLPGICRFLKTVGDFCRRWTSFKFEEGTTSQLLVLLSAKMGPMYHLLVGICANGYTRTQNFVDPRFNKPLVKYRI